MLPKDEDARVDITFEGNFGTEESGATSASVSISLQDHVDRNGASYKMMGIDDQDSDENSDIMLLYNIKQLDNVKSELGDILRESCLIRLLRIGFWCKEPVNEDVTY